MILKQIIEKMKRDIDCHVNIDTEYMKKSYLPNLEKAQQEQEELIKKINNLESENKELIEIFKHNYKVIKSNDLIDKLK